MKFRQYSISEGEIKNGQYRKLTYTSSWIGDSNLNVENGLVKIKKVETGNHFVWCEVLVKGHPWYKKEILFLSNCIINKFKK